VDTNYIQIGKPEHSYFIGFIQADGHLQSSSRNRGKLTLEIRIEDAHILGDFTKMFPDVYSSIWYRIRDTNFKDGSETKTLTICNLEFRNELLKAGITYGRKSDTVRKPQGVVDVDYFRGLLDGDGSLGITSQGFPYTSLVTISEKCATEYIDFLEPITGKRKTASRNQRDGAFNIMVTKEDAQKLVYKLYYPECLCLERKRKSAIEVLSWKRPEGMERRESGKKWDDGQDAFILEHSTKESMEVLGRSKSSIETRLWRLNKQ